MSRESGGVRREPPHPNPLPRRGEGARDDAPDGLETPLHPNPHPQRGEGADDRRGDPQRGDLVTATVCVLAVVAATVIGAVLIAATLRPGLEPPAGVLGMLGALLTGPLVLVRQRERKE